MIRSDKRLRLCTALLICNLIFIWGNSLLPGEVSGALSDWVKSILARIFSAGPKQQTGRGLLRTEGEGSVALRTSGDRDALLPVMERLYRRGQEIAENP